MSVNTIDNLNPKIAKHLDERLKTVSTFSSLPDPTVAANFLYVGAQAYVQDVDKYYKVIDNGSEYEWVLVNPEDLVIGTLNITSSTFVLDMSLVTPDISDCYAVQINIIGSGTSATIQAITNFPASDKLVTFYTQSGKTITFKHFDYDVATSDQIVLENGFDITISGRDIGNESVTFKKHGIAICQWDATQFMKASEWAQNLLSVAIYDGLDSTSTIMALSANQGKVLSDALALKQDILAAGEKIELLPDNPSPGITTINAVARTWNNTLTPTAVGDITAFLTGLYSGAISTEYRYVDLRN
jgi:hypothetical protein